MSSTRPGQHLDASAGRDVVYCHSCEHEWYQDQHEGLKCPRCENEATEIVSLANDPRQMHQYEPESPSLRSRRPDAYADSDPDEDDIEEHMQRGPGNYFYTSRVFRYPPRPSEPGGGRPPANPADPGAVRDRFEDGLFDFRIQDLPGAESFTVRQGGNANVRTTVFPGGSASFTITTAPVRRDPDGRGFAQLDFNSIFGDIMRDITAEVGASPNGNGAANGNGDGANRAGGGGSPGSPGNIPPHGFPITFQAILGAILQPGGRPPFGDAVFSQEALDRIVSELMEANPGRNAAPPASQSALDKLERKTLDSQMLGTEGKAECTICIDELHKGDEVVVLPCKHWFHGECVILWLKEHNTCPICRNPIEERTSPQGGTSSAAASASASASANATASANSNPPNPGSFLDGAWRNARFGPGSSANMPGSSSTNSVFGTSASSPAPQFPTPEPPLRPSASRADSSTYRRRDRLFRSPSENESRLNAIRNSAGAPTATPTGSSSRGTPPLGGYRRNSLSPPNMEASSSSRANGSTGSSTRWNSETGLPPQADAASQQRSFRSSYSSSRRRDQRSPSPPPAPSGTSQSSSLRRSWFHGDQRNPSPPPPLSSATPQSSHLRSLFFHGEQDRGEGGSGGLGYSGTNGAANQRGGGGGGPFGWIRDRLQGSGGGSGGSGSSSDPGRKRS